MVRETRYLWIGNLPHTIREDRILEHFKRYGKVQSVKILPKKEEESGSCATVAFIDIKSAAKAHNADNKIDDRTLKTDYYEPQATASSAIFIHERDDALVRPAPAPYPAGRTPRYGLAEERNYERPGHYYADREPYMRRPIGIAYHDEDNYQARAKSRDRYSRPTPGNNYTEGTERNQNHFRPHNPRQHFEQPRYPVNDQYNDEREPTVIPPRLNRRTNNTPATPAVASVASPTTIRTENRQRRTKHRTPSPTPSGSRSNSRSRSRSSSGTRSSSSSSKRRGSSSDSSRSRSPSKSRSPVSASYNSQNNTKGSRLDRPSSAIANPSSTACYLPSSVNTPAINCTSNNIQGSTPSQSCSLSVVENHCDREEKRPLGICVRNLPVRSTDTSLKDGLFHEYKKHGKVTMVKVIGQGTDRYAVVCFKKPDDVDKALEVSKDKLFFGCKIEVTAHEGLDGEDNEFRPLEAELDEFHPKATRTLFIGNLEKDITTPELRKHFEQFGEIIEIDIKKQGTATSYAFIQYSDIASVVKAMRKLDGENLGANRIKLGFGKSMPTNCVWLDGVADATDKYLTRHFNRYGIVIYTAVDKERGHALVFYETVEFAQIAVSEMRGRILQGKKLQVDFASRECQTAFFDKLEMTGQMMPGDGTRPWERRERRGPEFDPVRNDDREQRVNFENRVYPPRYEGPPRPPRGNFRGGQRAGFSSRGRGQGFPPRYEVYHDEFGERRHRYNSREESIPDVTMFDGKIERPAKYVENPECPNRKRNKLRNSISDQESHPSLSPPRSCQQSGSTSPVSKERKSLKERFHHRIKSPGSHNSSLVSSPCRDLVSDEMETNCRDSRSKNDIKTEEVMIDLSYPSPKSSSEKDCLEKGLSKGETDSLKLRLSVDSESADESISTSDQLGQIERKKRLLASSNLKGGKELNALLPKSLNEKTKGKIQMGLVNSLKPIKVNCVPNAAAEDSSKCETDNSNVPQECLKEKPQQVKSANDLKFLEKKQVHLLHLLEQLGGNVSSSDAEGMIDGDHPILKKLRSPSCSEANPFHENDIGKSLTKDECGTKMGKVLTRDSLVLNKLKTMTDNIDSNNCVSLSLDSYIFQKHLDPRKGSDQHSISHQKCRRISVDNETCLPNVQGAIDSFLYAASPVSADVSRRKDCNSICDMHHPDGETDGPLTVSHSKIKEEILSDEDIVVCNKKPLNSFPLDIPTRPVSLRTLSDVRHEIKRERDNSPLSLPLPKFAASLRSPKSSPSILTSPKSTTAHSPRAGFSPCSYTSGKNIRITDIFQEIQIERKSKDSIIDEKVNGATISPVDSISPIESHVINEISETISNMESIQSPKSIIDKVKEVHSSSESEFSPSASPNRPSIEDRIKALDEKFNAWSGSTRIASAAPPDAVPVVIPEVSKCPVKRSRFNFLAPEIREPSEIVKSLLARSTIFDQDSKRLQHIDEKYEPLDVKVDSSPPRVKPTFRTKAAAKEFFPVVPIIQKLNQSSSNTILVAQGIISPPATPQVMRSVLSPITPPLQYNTQLTSQAFTPCSPRAAPIGLTSATIKNSDGYSVNVADHASKVPNIFNSVKTKPDANFHINSSTLATSLKSPLHCSVDVQSQALVLNSPPNIRKEPASPVDNATEAVCKFEIECKVPIKNDVSEHSVITSIPLRKESCVSVPKDLVHCNSYDRNKKEFCDSKDSKLAFHEGSNHWRENGCKDEIKSNLDSCAKSFSNNASSDSSAKPLCPAVKKRVSSIDSTESESSKSVRSSDSSKDSQETNWTKLEKISEPEPKKPKLSKSVSQDHSTSPIISQHSRKSEKKDKPIKTEKSKVPTSKTNSVNIPEKSKSESKSNSKSDLKDKSKSEHKNKEEKRSKSRDFKESLNKEQRTKSRERRNSEKEKSGISNNPNKSKKESHSNKNEIKHESKYKYDNKSEIKHKSKNEIKVDSKNDIKHDNKIDTKHEGKSDANKHETKCELKHENKNDAKHESKSDAKHESKSDAKHESKSDAKHESKSDAKHESKSDTMHESKCETKHESKCETKHESKCETKHENKCETKHENRCDTKHESKSETKHENKNEIKHENKSEAKHEGKNEAKHENKSDTKHESKHESKTEVKHENRYVSKHETKCEIRNESDSECRSDEFKEKKQGERKSKKSSVSSLPFDLSLLDDEPVYFSMYDKVKARSSKSQNLKHQSTDMGQKFNKLKQSRASKREDKIKCVDLDSDKDTDSDHSSDSDSQTKSTRVKQPRKRKLVIESSSDEDALPQDSSSRTSKMEKDMSDSATDSDFDYNVSRRQSSGLKVRKKTDFIKSDSSDSDSNFASKSHSNAKKKSSFSRSKSHPEKSRKILKSDYESDVETQQKISKEKDVKLKKIKKDKNSDVKQDNIDYDVKKPSDDLKSFKKKSTKECKPDLDTLSYQKKLKPDHVSRIKSVTTKDRKRECSVEKMQVDDLEKHKPLSKKRKKSKKISKNKEKRSCPESSRKHDHDVKSSIPVLSPKPSNPLPEKQSSPPRLQAGVYSDNDFKSDFSDFEFGANQTDDMDIAMDSWKSIDAKSDSNSEKASKNKKKNIDSKSRYTVIHSPEQDSSLPSFFDKLSDITDSETGREPTDCTSDVPSEKRNEFLHKKEKDISSTSPFTSKLEDQFQKQEINKYSDAQSSSSKEGRRKKKSKKQSKEKKKKSRETKDLPAIKSSSPTPVPIASPKTLFDPPPIDDDSKLSEMNLDVKSGHTQSEFIVVSQESNTFGEEEPVKKEEKPLERRFEEEAAKETRRLEAELFSTGRDSWHMKEKDYDPEDNVQELCEEKHLGDIDSLTVKDEDIFTGLNLHSSVTEISHHETENFLSAHGESDAYKLDDKDNNEIEDQRKMEDDMAVSALLQEMNSCEISAPELTKETDYIDRLIETHPEDTMNYLLPDDGENSLHIADSPSEVQEIENQEEKLETSLTAMSPSPSSEPPALEISNIEDTSITKIDNVVETDIPETLNGESVNDEVVKDIQSTACYEFQESSIELDENKPPVIDIPTPDVSEQKRISLSPKIEHEKILKTCEKEKDLNVSIKTESNEDTDSESVSELVENQLTHFEDITMDITDNKDDDDNPPILQPVESPRNLLLIESKPKVETQDTSTEENHSFDDLTKQPLPEPVKEPDNILDKKATDMKMLSSDIDKDFAELTNVYPKRTRTVRKIGRNSDSHERCSMPLTLSDNSNDSLLISNSGLFENCNSPTFKPYVKFDDVDEHISSNFDEECSQDNYLSESLNSPLNQPLMNYSNILNPTCETVIQSPHKEENHSNTMSSPSNVQLFTESNDMRTISDTNNSTDDFLDELFGSKSIENEIIENDYQSETSKNNDNLVPSSDLKHKIEDADIFFTDTNQSSHDNPSFQISEVNEQNEATEFNQEIFERSSDTNKNTKVPQLLNFSSKQLFTDIPSKSNSDVIDNVSLSETKAELSDKHISPVIDIPATESKKDEFKFDPEEFELSDKMEEQINYSEKKDNLNEVPIIVEDGKSRPADAESICSDTTDITIPEVKTEAEISHVVPNEEPAQEEFHVDDVTSLTKPKIDRPRRGRRPKTRKYTEAIALKQDIEPSPNMTLTRSSSRRVRQASLEKIRRSLRSDASESHVLRESTKKRFSVDEPIQSETDDMKKDTSEEANDNFVSDPTVLEVDCTSGIVPSVIIDRRLTDKSQIKHEEPKRRRGRRKKASGDNQNSLLVDKIESKFDECETSKDLHRPKESRLWLSLSSCDKETKSSKDNTSRAIDVYEFVDEEDDRALTFESVKEKLHDTTRNSTTVIDSKNEKNDLKHNKIFEIKHDKGIEKTTEQKHEKGSDQRHDKGNDQKHEKGNDQKKHERGNDQKHDKGLDLKLDRGIDNVFEKEKKGDSKKLAAVEEAGTREHHPEVKEQKRISITIRLHQKDGHDGTSPGTAEVVKTSETVNIEEVKPECFKNEKSSKHDVSTPEAPCKSTRKSTRLMKQAAQRSIIEEVVKSSGKNALHSEPVPTRVTRRSKSNRRSEENLSKDSTPSENSNDTNDDKNKNEPVFFIHDNTVKDIPEDKRKISCSSTEMSSNTDATMAESDKIQTRGGVQYLRNFRLRSTSRMESNKDVAVSNKDSDFQKKDIHTKSFEETVDVPQQKEVAETKEIPKDLKTTTDNTRVPPPLPVFKVEINKMKIDSSKEILHNVDKQTEQEDASNSQVLIDPITGVLSSVSDSYSEPVCQQRSENKIKDSGISVSVLSIKNLSKSGPLSEIASATSVIQENSKSNYINKTENFPERPPLVQSLRSRQVTDSLPQTGTNDVMPVSSENISKQPSLPEKESEPLKLNAKKNSVAASVLTMVNCIGSSASNNTVTLTDPVNTINSAYTQNSQGQSPVITRTISSLDSSQIKAPSHGYEPSIRTTAVVTLTPTNHLTQNVSAGQNKSSITSVSTSNKSELPSVYTSANIPPTSINEHISSQTSCKPLSLGVSLPAEHSNILIKQEINVPSSSSHNIPVPSTWPSSKLPTNRITDSHVHVSTIQSATTNNSAYSSKLEARPSKISHAGKNSSAFIQQTFPMSNFDNPLSGAHAHSANVGVISDILQNQYLQPKEYNMSSDQHYDRNLVQMVRSSTPITSNIPPEIIRPIESPHITTPPITSANHSLPSVESHSHGNSTLHLRQPPLMVSAHTSRALHHPELATLMHQQIMFSPFSHHSDLRVQPDVRTMGMNSHYGYSAIPSSADVSSNFKQPSQHRHHSTIMDTKAEQKGIDELSKVRHETRNIEEKSRSKSMRNKKEYAAAQKEKELKMIYSETRDDADSGRLLSSTSAIAPHSSRQPQHAHFASPILQMSPHIPSPHDRTTDSPVIANIYSVQGRISQLPLAGQVDDRGLGAHTSHLYKTDATEGIKPPIAHQTQPSTSPYHARQQLLGVPTIGSSAPAHIDIRSSNPAHSPNSIAYKKDAQQIASIHNARTLSRQGAPSVSPGSGTYLCIPTDHVVPPPAHTASPSTTVAIGHQLIPPHLVYQDPYVMQNYPVVWQGSLALKNDQAIVQMHYVSGNIAIAQESLPHGEYEGALLRIAQRMRLEPQQLEGVRKKTQLPDEHCVLLALPCGKNNFELYQQSEKLKTGFIQYLDRKAAAGIVNAAPPGSQQPAYVIHIFPACEFTSAHVAKTAPELFKIFVEMANVVIVIATV